MKAFLSSMSPELRARMETDWAGKSESEIAAQLNEEMSKATGFRIMNKKEISADEVLLSIYCDGLDKAEKFKMRRSGNEWKLAGGERD